MNTFNLTLDLAKAKQRQQQTIFVRQGDKNATTIVATITDHGAAASTTGLTARFQMKLPDGTHYYRKAASLSGNVATVALDEAQAASAVGRTDVAYFQLLQGSTVVASTESFTVIVLPDALADAEVPESYDSAIQDAIDALDAAVEQLPSTVEDVLADHPEWTTTVQDGSITKDKLATDLARDRERLLYRLDNLLTNALPEGETATASDAAQTPVAGLALYGRSTQDGMPTPSAPVPIVSVGAANLLPSAASALTASGLTFTVNADGSVHVSGTATATVAYDYLGTNVHNVTLAAGTYTLSGCPSGGSGSKWKLDINDTNDTYTNDYGSGTTFNVASTRTIRRCRIVVYSGQTVDFTFKPMLNAGSTAYPFVPYGNVGLWARRTSDASTYTVTPIDLDGHELRSLPDGTRDELTVGADGHAVLVQRVGEFTITQDLANAAYSYANLGSVGRAVMWVGSPTMPQAAEARNGGGWCTMAPWLASYTADSIHAYATISSGNSLVVVFGKGSTAAEVATKYVGAKLYYPLATPVTHDLGYVAAVPLCGPDLTAQAIPTAPMQLTYERDLNATLARLESAIATLA